MEMAGKRDLDVSGNVEIEMAYSPPAKRRRTLEKDLGSGQSTSFTVTRTQRDAQQQSAAVEGNNTALQGSTQQTPARDVAQCKPPDC